MGPLATHNSRKINICLNIKNTVMKIIKIFSRF